MIGIFDSGLGGLTVVRALQLRRPDLPLLCLSDTARTPYGSKGPETIRRYAEEAARFLQNEGAAAVFVACNTASALATEHLRAAFPSLTVFEVIQPAVDAALAATRNNRIGVIATRATVDSGVYESRLRLGRPEARVISSPAPLLVPLVEEGWLDAPETASIVERYVAPLRAGGVDTLILGCTHYPMLKPIIAARMGPGVTLVDSAEASVASFCATIGNDSRLEAAARSGTGCRFCVTALTPNFAALAAAWLGEPVTVSKVSLQ